ncbi:hypothetical protein PV08_06401 [Exophiala spinifera]|uniref:Galactose oxidase-like Early set domain-containing protein n=1 Tax=Exophiala spinifera TaxID=91928 RepID=A0A0D2BCJ7_9EURO|nr:uncharacterized protein PV08_06401 [Exophiala spinifera]KIW16350.1 hypothetical protein PV08_06401 [Exophiala spinifera]
MYPFLHLLPDGSLFIFADRSSETFDVTSSRTIETMPELPGLHRTYPNTGGSVMLPLHRSNNYEPEIMICGGGQAQAVDSLCDATCGRLRPLSSKPKWQMTSMPEPRGMVEAVLLLDGTVLWLNGYQQGAQGFGLATEPALEALIYDPEASKWSVHGKSRIPRLYHSVALLMLDGTVLVASSNPNEMPVTIDQVDGNDQQKAFPTEFRIESYTPVYLKGNNASRRPTDVKLLDRTFAANSSCEIEFSSVEDVESLDIVLYSGGFVTHSLHMGQVMVYLEHSSWETSNAGRTKVQAYMPDGVKIAPGPYVVYIVANGVPGIGQFVTFKL